MATADTIPSVADPDPLETAEWLDSLRGVLEHQGADRVEVVGEVRSAECAKVLQEFFAALRRGPSYER